MVENQNIKAIEILSSAIQNMIDKKIENAPRDRTRSGMIVTVNDNGTYKVLVDGKEYDNVQAYGTLTMPENQIVKVVYPDNNPTNMFILPPTQEGGDKIIGGYTGTGTIATTGWSANTGDYGYKLDIALTGITSSDIVNIQLDPDKIDVAEICELCPTCESYTSGITVYAKYIPTTSIDFSFYKVRTVTSDGSAIPVSDNKYTNATAGSNGDFYITMVQPLATNDIVYINFPTATNGASNARLSVDGGTTYKNIKLSTVRIASEVQNKKLSFVYDGTDFIPIETEYFSIAYTPTITAASGTITTASGTASYVKIGNIITVTFSVTVTTAGTGTGSLNISIPFTSNGTYFGSGRCTTTGDMVQIELNSTVMKVLTYNNATVITNGKTTKGTLTFMI